MKNLILIITIMSFAVLGLSQTPTPTPQEVTISQETADAAAQAMKDVVAFKEVIRLLKEAGVKDKATIEGLEKLVKFYELTVNSQNAEITALRASIRDLFEFVIKRPTKKCIGIINIGC